MCRSFRCAGLVLWLCGCIAPGRVAPQQGSAAPSTGAGAPAAQPKGTPPPSPPVTAAEPLRTVLAETKDPPWAPDSVGAGVAGVDKYGDALPAGAYARLGTVRLRHPRDPAALRFSPDGRVLASLSGQGDPRIHLWQIPSGALLGTLPAGEDEQRSAVFSPDGRLLVTGGNTGVIHLWDLASRTEVARLAEHKGSVRSLAFLPDGSLLGSASEDGTVLLWDMRTRTVRRRFAAEGAKMYALALSARGFLLAGKGPLLVYGGSERNVSLQDLGSGVTLMMMVPRDSYTATLAISPDGRHVAVAGDYVSLWDLRHLNDTLRMGSIGEYVRAVQFSPNGKLLASVSVGTSDVHLWDMSVRPPRPHSQPPGYGQALDFSPDGKLLATSHAVAIHLWNIAARAPLVLWPHAGEVRGVAFSPDGQRVVTGSNDGSIAVWDVTSGRLIQRQVMPAGPFGLPRPVESVAYAAGGKEILAGGYLDGVQRFSERARPISQGESQDSAQWTVGGTADGQLAVAVDDNRHAQLSPPGGDTGDCLTDHEHPAIREISFSLDKRRVIAGGSNGAWICELGKRKPLKLAGTDGVSGVALSRDGETAAVGLKSEVRLFAAATGVLRQVLTLPVDVTALSYAPDRELLLIGGKDGVVRLWRPKEARLLGALHGHRDAVQKLAISIDGRTLATASDDTTVLLWRIPQANERSATP